MAERVPLTVEQANAVYDILVRYAGASEHNRDDFVTIQTHQPCTEYRFMGSLGFGGKFWRNDGRWYVSAYPEDIAAQPERERAIRLTNGPLAGLKAASDALSSEQEAADRLLDEILGGIDRG
jgi:hypothetical protein